MVALLDVVFEMFQSTPAIADGRTGSNTGVASYINGFNPRPPSLTGEPIERIREVCEITVSIHARHR